MLLLSGIAYFLKNSSCVYHTLLYLCLLPYFIVVYIIYFLNIDISICMDVRRIGCWSSLAYIFDSIYVMYYYFVSDMYCMHQAK